MTRYCLAYQSETMTTPAVVTFDTATARALFEISISAYVLATRKYEIEENSPHEPSGGGTGLPVQDVLE